MKYICIVFRELLSFPFSHSNDVTGNRSIVNLYRTLTYIHILLCVQGIGSIISTMLVFCIQYIDVSVRNSAHKKYVHIPSKESITDDWCI